MRRRFDGSFKARVALEAIRGERTVTDIAAGYRVHLTSRKMSLSRVKSAIALFSLVFSCSSSFKRRAWDNLHTAIFLSPAVIGLLGNP